MRFDIMTLFPATIEAVLGESIIGRARKNGIITVQAHDIRDYLSPTYEDHLYRRFHHE